LYTAGGNDKIWELCRRGVVDTQAWRTTPVPDAGDKGGSKMVRTVALALILAAPSAAFAQAKGKPPAGKAAAPAGGGDAGVVYKQKTVYDFDDDVVEGDLVRPDGEFIDTRRGGKISSLIKIRQHFIPEMLKSAEDI
jgi:hypothetical protein